MELFVAIQVLALSTMLADCLILFPSRVISEEISFYFSDDSPYKNFVRHYAYRDALLLESVTTFRYEAYQFYKKLAETLNLSSDEIESFSIDAQTMMPLSLIINEMITNSLKYAFKGDEVGTITVKLNQVEWFNELLVSDNGKGIANEVKDLIFEPKFTTKTSGMGLGLGMIKNIIEAYNGEISFTSNVGIGSVFTVILPKK